MATNSRNTFNQRRKYRKLWINRSSANIVSSDTTTATTRNSRHRYKSSPVLHVLTPNRKSSVTGSIPSPSSSISSFSLSFCEVCYDTDHVRPKCPMLAQDSLSQLAIIRSNNMRKVTKGERPITSRKVDLIASAASEVAEVELHCHQIRIRMCPCNKKSLLVTRKARTERQTDELPESTNLPGNRTARTTGSATCTFVIGTYPWWRNKNCSRRPVRTHLHSRPYYWCQMTKGATKMGTLWAW